MTEAKTRKLGRRQQEVLDLIKEHGTYYRKCGWKYNSHSETAEILLSLESKGYVKSHANDEDVLVYEFVKEPERTDVDASVSEDSKSDETHTDSSDAPILIGEPPSDTYSSHTPDADAVEGYPNAEVVTPSDLEHTSSEDFR